MARQAQRFNSVWSGLRLKPIQPGRNQIASLKANPQCATAIAEAFWQSGKLHKAKVRWACDKFLRHTVHLWANSFRRASVWGQVYYRQKRQKGMSHACALRCLGQRLLKILFRMISDKHPYDAELHARNQQKHGSWVLALMEKTAAKTGDLHYPQYPCGKSPF